MKRLLFILTLITLVGCSSHNKENADDIIAHRHMPFSDVKEQPEPEDIILKNPELTDHEWAREWFETISAHDVYLQNYIRMLVTTTGVGPKIKCDLKTILRDIKEPKLPVIRGITDPEEINLILAKSVRSLYDSNISLLELLRNCK